MFQTVEFLWPSSFEGFVFLGVLVVKKNASASGYGKYIIYVFTAMEKRNAQLG